MSTRKSSTPELDEVGNEKRSVSLSDIETESEQHRINLRGRRLTASLAFVAGTAFTLFGYDQGVMSALLTANQFEKVFPQVVVSGSNSNHATLQSFVVAVYEVGCLFGALSNLWIGDRLGRRRTIMLSGAVMIIGAILQTTSYSYAQLVVARIVTGLGNGLNTSTVPSYHAECSPAKSRGAMIMLEGTLLTFGVTISSVYPPPPIAPPFIVLQWIDFALYWASWSSVQWRVPIALQLVLELIMIISIGFLPESPRWLVKHGRKAEALAVISAIDDKPPNDPGVRRTFHGMCEAVEMEEGVSSDLKTEGQVAASRKVSLKELLSGGPSQNLRRTILAFVCQCCQQITGVNLITYYATLLFERLGIASVNSRIIAAANGTEYFLASFVAIALIERVGRRKLMLFGTIGQGLTMVLLAILGSINNSTAQVISAVLLFVFNTFHAIGWLAMAWLYVRLHPVIRHPLSSVIYNGGDMFAALNAAAIPVVYWFFPETSGRSLEGKMVHTFVTYMSLMYSLADMDVVFALAYKEGVSPVTVSLRKDVPPAGSPEADEILGITTRSRTDST
ncbi:hypothetical protein HYDPIDRAFT_23342 [Hydnomerulius pinastri MD-312]|nr:hypothetical protein HYDPIDRAFT_23342 [Hydnomerulius pinastri MD-312]